jgi:predicted enzyme related to lactoylglutathione lyase
MTKDLDAATAFYTALFGWTTEPFGDTYSILMNGERPAGGMIAIDEQMGPVPPNWSVYFAVDDCDAIHQRAVALGGTVAHALQRFPRSGPGLCPRRCSGRHLRRDQIVQPSVLIRG